MTRVRKIDGLGLTWRDWLRPWRRRRIVRARSRLIAMRHESAVRRVRRPEDVSLMVRGDDAGTARLLQDVGAEQ